MSYVLRERFNCERLTLIAPDSFPKPDGTAHAAVYAFIRTVDGEQREAVVHVLREDEPVIFGMINYVCRSLRIANTRDLTHWQG